MTEIRRVQPVPPAQPTIQIYVYVPPDIRPEWVRGKIFEIRADGTERLIERIQADYVDGVELDFFTEERGENIQYEVKAMDSQRHDVAIKKGPAQHLDYLHSLHLNRK